MTPRRVYWTRRFPLLRHYHRRHEPSLDDPHRRLPCCHCIPIPLPARHQSLLHLPHPAISHYHVSHRQRLSPPTARQPIEEHHFLLLIPILPLRPGDALQAVLSLRPPPRRSGSTSRQERCPRGTIPISPQRQSDTASRYNYHRGRLPVEPPCPRGSPLSDHSQYYEQSTVHRRHLWHLLPPHKEAGNALPGFSFPLPKGTRCCRHTPWNRPQAKCKVTDDLHR